MTRLIHFAVKLRSLYKLYSEKLRDAAISAHSGQAAFFMILSFFPFIMFLLSLLKYVPLSEETLLSALQMVFPPSFDDYITNLIGEIYWNHSASILPLTMVTAVWLGSKAFLSLIVGLNSMYQIQESRNYIILRLLSFLYTILFALLLLATLAVLVFGNTLYYHLCRHFPFLNDTLLSIISFRSLAGFIIMLLFFTILYKVIPDCKNRFMSQIPGALVATTGWILFSYLYSYYIDHISNYSFFYGTMTMIAFLMIWLYACMYILFFGGLVNYLLNCPSSTLHPEK